MTGIGDRLRKIREELGLKQGEFSERIGLKQGSYSDMENEKKPLLHRNIKLICLEFGVNIDWLQNGGDGPIFKRQELTPEEKELVELYAKLVPETQKEILAYAHEKLELQELRAKADTEKGVNPIHEKKRG